MKPFNARLVLVLLPVVLGTPACSPWEANGVDRLGQLFPQPDAGPNSSPGCALPDMLDGGAPGVPSAACLGLLDGQWAARFVQLGVVSPPVIPPSNVVVSDLYLVTLSADKTSLQMQFCGEENLLTDPMSGAPVMLGENVTPPALITGVGKVPVVVPIPGDGTLHANPVVSLWGWATDGGSPATDPLPTDAGDPRIVDEDGDGNLGVTVDVVDPEGEIYMVRRDVYNMGAGSTAGGWLTGPLQYDIQENILGASLSLLDATAPITPRPECNNSVYQMICVDPTFTCQDLVNSYQTLFINAPK